VIGVSQDAADREQVDPRVDHERGRRVPQVKDMYGMVFLIFELRNRGTITPAAPPESVMSATSGKSSLVGTAVADVTDTGEGERAGNSQTHGGMSALDR
jgi:hypothetical protein